MTGHTSDEVIRPNDVETRDPAGSQVGYPQRDSGVVQDGPGTQDRGVDSTGMMDENGDLKERVESMID
ncbi:hypothetical protein [Deinococcus sp. SL84]|uniref:hypothetical protein n=1 Tax=Deinococcus sp. SL84 TaxID=2994663 RepID=UPI0022733F0D|nr:hypothetical protein [Deinococcus sp. SL84]MCY1702934.1 hypothetical protein [Deinococcus sp. SL84]